MQVDLLSGMAYEEGTFNLQGGTDKQIGEAKLQEDIKILLTQEKGKFYPDPEFGSELQKYLFEPMTSTLGKQMQTEIKDLIEKYYPQITLIGIDISMDQESRGVYIDIRYKYSDEAQDTSTVSLALFNKVDS
jgi:hypothetical protein